MAPGRSASVACTCAGFKIGSSRIISMALTDKQRRFVEEYLVDLNATQAAIRAGYSERTARQAGAENLSKPDVAAAVAQAQSDRASRVEVTADRVVEELASLAFYDPADLVSLTAMAGPQDIPKLPAKVRRAIIGWGWDKAGNFTLKLAPKTTALELLGRHLGMFVERVEHSGSMNLVVAPEDAEL
jgi:phage terminase small subunit